MWGGGGRSTTEQAQDRPVVVGPGVGQLQVAIVYQGVAPFLNLSLSLLIILSLILLNFN